MRTVIDDLHLTVELTLEECVSASEGFAVTALARLLGNDKTEIVATMKSVPEGDSASDDDVVATGDVAGNLKVQIPWFKLVDSAYTGETLPPTAVQSVLHCPDHQRELAESLPPGGIRLVLA